VTTARISGDLIFAGDNRLNFLRKTATGDKTWCFLYGLQSKW